MTQLDIAPEGIKTLESGERGQARGKLEVLESPNERVTHLPAELSSFIGREDAVAECCALLAGRRLVTLTGPGGIGKSRLGLEVGRCSAARFRDGVFLVELASVNEPSLVPGVVATALGLAHRTEKELTDLLVVSLQSRELLLILDDCDRQVEACASLANRLLHDVPGLAVLATSRERLDVRGEVVWRVQSLRTPGPNASFDEIASSEAVRLFVERAHEVAPWFSLATRNAPDVAQLCRRLDGIPLAIELAAARMKALNMHQLLARLGANLELMMRGSRTAPTRQQTLRATIDWSYQLLNELERALFRRLSVFSGGFVIDAAEFVTRGEPLGPGDTLPVLEHLIDKSLVVSEARSGIVRQRMLETLREYARELLESGEEDQLRRRHCHWILDLFESTDVDWLTSEGVAARTLELDNLRAALMWAIDASEVELGLRLAVASGGVWQYTGHFSEGIRWLRGALELPSTTAIPSIRGGAHKWISILSYDLGDMQGARAAINQAHGLLVGATNDRKPPFCSHVLGNIERATGNLHDALQLYWRALADYQTSGMRFWEQSTLFLIGSVLFEQAEYAASRAACERCLGLGGEIAWATGRARVILAYLAKHDGQDAEAERVAGDALTCFRAQGEPSGIGIALRALAQFALEQRRVAHAWVCLAESLDIALSNGDRMALARTLESMSCVLASNEPLKAAQIAGAATAVRKRTETLPWPSEQARLERWLGVAQSRLSNRAYADAWRWGAGLSDAEAASAAMQMTSDGLVRHEIPKSLPATAAPLTSRQQQVAALVARGLTNEQIAVELVISPATARAHVEQILGRLDLHGRAQLAAWAVAHGIAAGDEHDSREHQG